MPIIAVDIVLKTALEAGIADLRANTWLLSDVFGGLSQDALSMAEYGDKETQRATQWFLSNHIDVNLQYRIDKPNFPSITVVDLGSGEMTERASLADDGSIEDFDPAGKEITPQYVYPPFTPLGYDPATGIVTMGTGLDTSLIVPGQFFVSAKSGKAYQITECISATQFKIKANVRDTFTSAYIAPPVALWNLHREQSFFRHSYALFAAGVSDPIYAIWIHAVLVYVLLRYKEAFLEARGIELTTFQSGPLTKDSRFDPESVYYKQVTLVGQVENSWVKFVAPRFQGVTGGIKIMDGPKTPPAYQSEVEGQAWQMDGDDGSVED